MRYRTIRRVVVALLGMTMLIACSSADPSDDDKVLTIAIVDNGDMLRIRDLADHFAAEHPDIELKWVVLREGELRQRVTTDIATGGGQFDVVALGAYETTIWTEKDWLVPFDDLPAEYGVDDLLPTVRKSLSHDDVPYALPFYGESSFTMYRTDLFDRAGLTMPDNPSWDFIKEAAQKLSTLDSGYGACLRGKAGWGENMAAVTSMVNSYGGRWFDLDWRPQLDTEPWRNALETYVALGAVAPPNVVDKGFNENIELFQQGKCAIWIDSTAAGSFVSDPRVSTVADKVGFAPSPAAGTSKGSNWLWTWSLAIPTSSEHRQAARDFVMWATSSDYIELVADELGWVNAPPGTRASLYARPEYTSVAPFAPLTLAAIESADIEHPTVDDVPYTGIQYVAIPEFQGLGTAVGNQVADALTGSVGVDEALDNAQWVTEKVIDHARLTTG